LTRPSDEGVQESVFPLWDVAIAPVLRAAGARRVVEIGALRGETTVRMLESLGPDAELHVIDPVPGFDPAEHAERFPGRYHFHQALSLDMLANLPPVDAALVDGDHNWYTVYNELRLLAEGARRHGTPLPVLVLHDVLWPYGRRDLYYAPEQIPEEFRQPYAQAGMLPGSRDLVAKGGLNPTMNNARREGGPRNGVMTGLEDFLAEHANPVRVVVVPIYFGLAIVVEEQRLTAEPALAAALDRLESAAGRHDLLEVAEEVHLRAMIFQHNVFFKRAEQLERAVARHLAVVKASLLNEHYLDHEVRLDLLAHRITSGAPLLPDQLRDPARHHQVAMGRLQRARTGPAGPDDAAARSFVPYTAMGRPQLDHLHTCLDRIRAEEIDGDLAECGTGRGGGAIFLRAYLDAHELGGVAVWVADRFRSTEAPDQAPTLPRTGVAGFLPDLNLVRDGFARFGLLDDRVRFLQGPLGATLHDAPIGQLALLRIGRSAAGEAGDVLARLYDRVVPGGFVVVDAGAGGEARAQVEAFRAERGLTDPVEPIDSSSFAWRKSVDEPVSTAEREIVTGAPRAPLPAPRPLDVVDLTVVLVLYNMRREAARTLHSLSRAYQEGIGDVDYEVLVVENGSDPDQRVGADAVAAFGPEFRYIDLGDEAHPSPVVALNRGIREGRGNAFALMIDGAHVVTPGVIRFGLLGLETYEPAIVATQQWYIGPGQQPIAMVDGYDQVQEDRLFDRIGWPASGYRLFEIGHFVGDRDWLDGVWESNCMFVGRKTLERYGGFDESFSVAGGGYANLELYERLGSATDITVATILGEASFHQVHGGTTTNQADATERRSRIHGYSREYADLRGRPFKGPGKPLHFVGRLTTDAARRTKPRRLSTSVFADAATAGLPDGRPASPIVLPDELAAAFTEAVWQNLPWRSTTWLGRQVRTAPTDLLAYQEIIGTVRPDVVIDVIGSGDHPGSEVVDAGRAGFLASVCDLVGHGTVAALGVAGTAAGGDEPGHPRLRRFAGDPLDPATVEAVEALVAGGSAVVVLGACADRATTVRAFEAYHRLVPVGSYVVVTDTVVNGHPVWTSFGPGPLEAVKQILSRHGEYMADPAMEKYHLTFNPSGYLRRRA
jgi:cephalosporin hydroxylase